MAPTGRAAAARSSVDRWSAWIRLSPSASAQASPASQSRPIRKACAMPVRPRLLGIGEAHAEAASRRRAGGGTAADRRAWRSPGCRGCPPASAWTADSRPSACRRPAAAASMPPSVIGCSRVPEPPASIMPFMPLSLGSPAVTWPPSRCAGIAGGAHMLPPRAIGRDTSRWCAPARSRSRAAPSSPAPPRCGSGRSRSGNRGRAGR